MRELGVDETVILKLREHQADFLDYDMLSPVELEELDDVQRLLDAIEDEELLHIMLGADMVMLQILLLRVMATLFAKLRVSWESLKEQLQRSKGVQLACLLNVVIISHKNGSICLKWYVVIFECNIVLNYESLYYISIRK